VAEDYAGLSVFRECFHSYWLANAAHLAGMFGSHWLTDVAARNLGTGTAHVQFRLYSSDGVEHLFESVGSGAQGTFLDLVGLMGYEGKGCIEVRSDQPLQVSGRIFNQADEGTFGQYVDGYKPTDGLSSGESATLL